MAQAVGVVLPEAGRQAIVLEADFIARVLRVDCSEYAHLNCAPQDSVQSPAIDSCTPLKLLNF